MEQLSISQARRVALAAQGFADNRPSGAVDRRHGRRVFDRIGLIQVDSVNVLVRSQELPMFARLGSHRRDLIPSMIAAGDLFEFWGHEASLIPVDDHHLYRWKMSRAREAGMWAGLAKINQERPQFVNEVLAEVRDRGPLSAGELSGGSPKQGPWWGWGPGKTALEYLFRVGAVTARRRPNNFEREYLVPEALFPAHVLERVTPSEPDARKELLVRAVRSLGVATDAEMADYHRQKVPLVRPLIAELVEDARIVPVRVEGWAVPAYRLPDLVVPRRVHACALVSPFDSLVWNRDRTERLFGFHYRIEIYVPEPKRVFGYYVLPFLFGDELVARVDLKADRHGGALLVHGAYLEAGADGVEVVNALAGELRRLASWLDLARIEIGRRGDLVGELTAAIKSLPK